MQAQRVRSSRGRAASARPPAQLEDPTRLKLIAGLLSAVEEKGYATLTIADIVRLARVSKRTFYEHFADKEECFLAGYRAASQEVLGVIAAAASPDLPPGVRIHAAATAYIAALEAQPELTRTFLLEIHAAGPRALQVRREIHRGFADLVCRLVQVARRDQPSLRPLSPAMATAVVGGINELVLVALEQGQGTKLHDVAGTAEELLRALLAPRR